MRRTRWSGAKRGELRSGQDVTVFWRDILFPIVIDDKKKISRSRLLEHPPGENNTVFIFDIAYNAEIGGFLGRHDDNLSFFAIDDEDDLFGYLSVPKEPGDDNSAIIVGLDLVDDIQYQHLPKVSISF